MTNLTEILENIRDDVEGDRIRLGEIVARFQGRGFGPLLLVPALIAILPTGAIPGVPAVCAVFIILISGQILLGKHHPWLPRRIREFSVPRDRFEYGFSRVRPWTRQFDRLLSRRLVLFTRDTATRIVACIAILLALVMIPLELIPLACSVPALSIALFAIGLSAQDGLFTLLALIVAAGACWMAWHFWPF